MTLYALLLCSHFAYAPDRRDTCRRMPGTSVWVDDRTECKQLEGIVNGAQGHCEANTTRDCTRAICMKIESPGWQPAD